MREAISILFGAGFTVAVCMALGALILRLGVRLSAQEERIFAFVIGAAALSATVFALCAIHAARSWVFLAFGIVSLAIAVRSGSFRRTADPLPPLPQFWRWLFVIVFTVYGVLYFFHAMAPETSPDGSSYHLGMVARYLQAHGFERITTNMYASLPGGVEMLFLFAFAFGRHSAAALVHFAFLVALPLAMLLYARRFGFAPAGVCGALLVFVTPVVGIDGISAYNDVALACVLFALFYLLEVWDAAPPEDRKNLAMPALAGLLAGFAFAIKYTALAAIPYALGFVVWRAWRRGESLRRPLAMMATAQLLMALPWMLKNWLWAGNPVAPFLNRIFPNPYVHISFEQAYTAMLREPGYYALKSAWELPWALTIGGSVTGILGPVFLLAPLGLLAARTRAGRRLLFAGVLFGATYATNLGCRFLIPALPFFALSLGLAVANVRSALAALALAHALLSWPRIVNKYYPPAPWRIRGIPVREALRIAPEDTYLRAKLASYSHARMIEQLTPPGARVLALDSIADAYTTREIVTWYQSALGEAAADILLTAWRPDRAPTHELTFRFPAQSLRRIRAVQRGAGREPWSVSELRVLFHGGALRRAPEWRLRAHPNPWDVQMAFDNSAVTRWNTWQAAFPGMFLDVEFGAPELVDAVTLECPAGPPTVSLTVEGQSQTGEWKRLAESPEVKTRPTPMGMRRAAIRELKLLGLDYVFIHDANELGEDLRVDGPSVGMVEVGEAGGGRLYRLN